MTGQFLDALATIKGLKVWGPPGRADRVATIAVPVKGWSSSDLAAALEREAGIMTRAGLQCAPLAHRALGTLPEGGVTRFSFGFYNTQEEIQTAVETLDKLARIKN